MKKIKYTGPLSSVELLDGRILKRGEAVTVPDPIAEALQDRDDMEEVSTSGRRRRQPREEE
jgi:hypothetical protein